MIRVERTRGLREIDPETWDSLLGPDRIVSSHAHLLAVEEANINDCCYYYLLFYDGERLVAHSCLFTITFDLDLFNQGASRAVISEIRKVFPRFLTLRLLECGCPTALGSVITFLPDVNLSEVVRLFVNEAEAIAREQKIGMIWVRDFTEEEAKHFDLLLSHGFRRLDNLPEVVMELPWQSFDEYLGALRKKYRQRTNTYLRTVQEKGLRVEVRECFLEMAKEFHKLYLNVYERATEYRREILTPEYFQNLDRELGNKSEAVLFWKGDKLVGFYVAAIDSDTYRGLYLGMDYEWNREYYLLFNLRLMGVRRAIELGKRYIEMGITDVDAKTNMGGVVVPLYIYMKHRNKLVHSITTRLFSMFTPPVQLPQKRVFREQG